MLVYSGMLCIGILLLNIVNVFCCSVLISVFMLGSLVSGLVNRMCFIEILIFGCFVVVCLIIVCSLFFVLWLVFLGIIWWLIWNVIRLGIMLVLMLFWINLMLSVVWLMFGMVDLCVVSFV